MPGLVGIVQKQTNGSLDRGLFQRMITALRHRPWYQVDRYLTPEVAVARLHLNIINPAPQPYISENGQLRVFLHGEIYNDETTEMNQLGFIAQAYERFGLDFAAQLNGSFVVVLMDAATDLVLIATDRTASKPVFYYQNDAALYFAPELKALLLIPTLPRRINLSATASFLACGHYLNGQALLEDLHPLDNATVLIVSADGVMTHRYWQYAFNEAATDRGIAYYQQAMSELIRQAVCRRIRSQHHYGILLSGGYDSRGILGCYLDERPKESVTTISWGVAEDVPRSDCAIAQRLAHRLQLPHTFFPLRMAELAQHVQEFIRLHDGLSDACYNYPESLKIFSDIRTQLGVQVILRGDESFGFSRPACDERTIFEKFSIVPLERSRSYQKILSSDWLLIFSDAIRQTICDIRAKCNAKDINLYQNFVYFDQRLKHYINPLNYMKSLDVEVRTPYLDNDILDFLCELPAPYHFGKLFYRDLLVKMFPQMLSEIAIQSNVPDLHAVVRNGDMQTVLSQVNLSNESPLSQFFEVGALKDFHDNYFSDSHRRESSRKFVEKAGKFLRRWPSIYQALYKMYLPIQDRQQYEFISRPRIILRIFTINLILESFNNSFSHLGNNLNTY